MLLGDRVPQLKPVKSGAGQRMYRRSDLQCVVRIKSLLYDGYTIAEARQQLRNEGRKNHRALKTQEPRKAPGKAWSRFYFPTPPAEAA